MADVSQYSHAGILLVLGGYFILLITSRSGSFKTVKSNNLWFWAFEDLQNQKKLQSRLFRRIQGTANLHARTSKESVVS